MSTRQASRLSLADRQVSQVRRRSQTYRYGTWSHLGTWVLSGRVNEFPVEELERMAARFGSRTARARRTVQEP